MQSPSKEKLVELRRKHFLPTPALYYSKPLQLVRAKGVYAYDEEGNQYLDAIGGIVCISAGHNHPKIKAEAQKMLNEDCIQHTSALYLNKYSLELAEKLASKAPNGVDRCALTNSGSEANELAFMAARNATGETMVVNLRHSYHGGTAGTLTHCGHYTWRFRSQPVASSTSAMEPYCYRCPFGKKPESCNLECAKNVETTIQTTTHGRIAAFIAEPVMGVGGFITPPDDYFKEVIEIVHRYGGKYISDEVQTGAGRCGGEFLLTRELGIDADIITMAKGLGNGAAIGGVLMKSDIADAMAGKAYFNTFAGDPYPAMQASITVDIIEEENLIKNARDMGKLLTDGLKDLMSRYEIIGDVRGRGLLVGMELVKDRKTKEHAPALATKLLDLCRDRGLLIGKGGLMGNIIRLAPPLSINRKEVEQLIKILDQSLQAL